MLKKIHLKGVEEMEKEIQFAKALEKLAEVLKDPEVARFISQAMAPEGVVAAHCSGCCFLFAGGQRRRVLAD